MAIRRVKTWLQENERKVSSFALLFGFVFDNLTLRRVDLFIENLVFATYLTIASLSILVINLIDAGRWSGKWAERAHPWLSIVIQFALGNLFSGFIVFYSRSTSAFASWPFLVFLLAIAVGNEYLKKHYVRLAFQVSVLFVALFSYMIFFVPILLGRLGDWVFILTGLVTLLIISAFVLIVRSLVRDRFAYSRNLLVGSVAGLYVLMNVFYFTNLLPPLPLSLKEAGIYHSLEKIAGGYRVEGEEVNWRERFIPQTIHLEEGQPLYAYSAVFSPTNIKTQIVHNWQFYDPYTKKWRSVNKIPFAIAGGRDGGYRGYTRKNALSEGKWRVDVENARGQVIGRVRFNIIETQEPPALETKEL